MKTFIGLWLSFILIILIGECHYHQAHAQTRDSLRSADFPPKKTIRVAIVDTGFIKQLGKPNVKLCKTGHYDFILNKPGIPVDILNKESHGTFISNIIAADLEDSNYCIVVYRVWQNDIETEPMFIRVQKALRMAAEDNVTAVNYSIQGLLYSATERAAFVKALSQGIKIFVAAGNDNQDLDQKCISYPACYKDLPSGMYVVGAVTDSDPMAVASYSNHGSRIDVWKYGSYIDQDRGMYARGTSFAAPRALSDYVRSLQAE